ncbi:MAG: Fe-S cluster assembly protein SufD [Pseudoxanthomonas suwonensis]|nr:Fe-S cluster assembly protein SufD [Pseudoxanthomonas suwonensis]
MTTLLQSLLQPADPASVEAIARDGLPGARSEAWKYTPLRALERRSFAPAQPASIDAAALAHIDGPRLVFVNGRFDAALSRLGGLPAGIDVQPLSRVLAESEDPRASGFLARRYSGADEVFPRINAALAREGLVLRVGDGVRSEQPLHLVHVGTAADSDQAWHLRHFVELRRDAALTLVEHQLHDAEHAHLANTVSHVHLAQGARLRHVRVQDEAVGSTQLLRTDAVLARDSLYRRTDVELGAALSRHELNVRLEGHHARLEAGGALLADGRRHVDTRLGIDHVAGDTSCELNWRGMADGRGRVVFHGGIEIRAGADGTDAQLQNKNLLLSDNAEIDTQPVLVIHADEVTAAHGATVGQLDPTALFYLRSRGIGLSQARSLLTTAFCREALGADAPQPVVAALEKTLSRMGSA